VDCNEPEFASCLLTKNMRVVTLWSTVLYDLSKRHVVYCFALVKRDGSSRNVDLIEMIDASKQGLLTSMSYCKVAFMDIRIDIDGSRAPNFADISRQR
jgi:hypothetical protein